MTDELLVALDPEQRQAAETLLGPVCILAGAGTGKTRAITHRVAYGVASGVYSPSRVMALTFTNRAAGELRTRLRALGAGGVRARTFHSAALAQLSHFWPLVVGGPAPRIVAGKARLLAQVAGELGLRLDTATLRDVAAEVEWRKVSGLGIDDYAKRLGGHAPGERRHAPGALDDAQLIEIMAGYESAKDERRQLDFEDVLLATAGMLETEPSVAMQVREQYRFFVVDEYQDVSPLQQQLLELWLGGRDDLCVVGDASQTIYSFAGASSAYLLGFEKRYPDATVVRLVRNYRSTTPIVAAANRLLRGRPGALELQAANAEEGVSAQEAEPTVGAYETDADEARAVAAQIAAQLKAGVKPQSIAVLYRVNAQSAALESALADAGVPYRVAGGARFFDRPEVKQAVMALRAAAASTGGESLFRTVSDVLRGLGWSQTPPEAAGAVRERWDALNALMTLAGAAPPGTTLRAFSDELRERQENQHEPDPTDVTLATLHSAKGLEWDHVYLVGLSEGLVPISYADTLDAVDEERRLFYVGLTRARRRLRLSWSRSSQAQSSRRERSPSRFLEELGSRIPDGSRSDAR